LPPATTLSLILLPFTRNTISARELSTTMVKTIRISTKENPMVMVTKEDRCRNNCILKFFFYIDISQTIIKWHWYALNNLMIVNIYRDDPCIQFDPQNSQ
jgi:hypothetical protein